MATQRERSSAKSFVLSRVIPLTSIFEVDVDIVRGAKGFIDIRAIQYDL